MSQQAATFGLVSVGLIGLMATLSMTLVVALVISEIMSWFGY